MTFSADVVRVDQLFRVVVADGRTVLFHIEFQGRTSHRPMKWRMLEYMTRIADAEPDLDLLSVVFYVGQGAGLYDSGEYRVAAPDGTTTLQWHYRVVRLWQMTAEDLLAFARPGLLPLVGQTQIEKPAEIIPQVVRNLKQVADLTLQTRLLTSLLALTSDEEIVQMIERLSEADELLSDTPYLRRLREKAWQEGFTEGRAEAQAKIRRQTRKLSILDALVARFEPSVTVYRAMEKRLAAIEDDERIDQLFVAVIRAATLAEFEAQLATPPTTPEQQP